MLPQTAMVNVVTCSLLMIKTILQQVFWWVNYVCPVTIPRMKLTVAVTSIKVANLFQQELKYPALEHVFWTDSKIVLGYIVMNADHFTYLLPTALKSSGVILMSFNVMKLHICKIKHSRYHVKWNRCSKFNKQMYLYLSRSWNKILNELNVKTLKCHLIV